jgi:DNA-binding response OmpR family regulator
MLHDLLFRLLTLMRHPAAENELDDELRFHLERQTDKYVKSGMSQAEALRRARLEFGAMEYLQRRAGEAVPRVDLLQNVWEQSYTGGSNVVDVVIRALRKKLSDKASLIETVQGVGYRLRRE